MKATYYAEAIVEAIADGVPIDTALQSLDRILIAEGHQKLKKHVLTELVIALKQKVAKATPIVTLARASDEQQYNDELKNELGTLTALSTYQTEIDPHLAGGYIISYKGTKIDRSYKSKLLELYSSITKTV